MHPNNPFLKAYDFDKLVLSVPSLAAYVFTNQYGTKTIKFSEQNAVKALNTALLKTQYNVNWSIPEHNLCPPIPGRLDYLLHVKDLIDEELGVKEITLLDIGTGANLIYPILGTCHFNWKCVGSESNRNSFVNAQAIIENNVQLKTIQLLIQDSTDKIFENIILTNDYFDVVVCNPPFFKNRQDAEKNNLRKVKNLKLTAAEKLNFGGLNNELWCKGGEEAFVKKMAIESVNFKNQIHWFTVLISNKDHLKNIKRTLNKLQATKVKVIDMEQGNKMSRFVAWTFSA